MCHLKHSCPEVAGIVYRNSEFDILLFDPHINGMIRKDSDSNDLLFLGVLLATSAARESYPRPLHEHRVTTCLVFILNDLSEPRAFFLHRAVGLKSDLAEYF